MSNYEIFVIGSQEQYEEMVKLGEYQKSCLKDVYPNSVITVTIAETGCEPDMKEARDINGERKIPGRQRAIRRSNVPVLTSHAGLNH